jgi:hypothetical protein
MGRNQTAVARTQVKFAFCNPILSRRQESFDSVPLCFLNEQVNRYPGNFSRRSANHFCKPAIRVEHGAIARKSRRAFAHGLHQHAIGGLSAFQSDYPLSTAAQNHQSIHFAGLYGG